jgi:hypothetical protein
VFDVSVREKRGDRVLKKKVSRTFPSMQNSVTRTVVFFVMLNNQAISFLFLTLDELYLNIFSLFNYVVGVSERAVLDYRITSVYSAGKEAMLI